jgi:Universal stress protein family
VTKEQSDRNENENKQTTIGNTNITCNTNYNDSNNNNDTNSRSSGPEEMMLQKILRIVDKQKVDTIVIGSRGVKASKEFLVGSASYKVTHYAKCPVVIVR